MTKRNKYSLEFKQEAINMVLNEEKSVDEVGGQKVTELCYVWDRIKL